MSNNVSTEFTNENNVFIENKLLKAVCVFIAIVSGVNYLSLQDLKEDYRSMLSFPTTLESMEMTGSTVDQRYLMMAVEFVTGTWFAATPSTAEKQHSIILTMVHPTQYDTLKQRFRKRATLISQLKTTSIYGNVDWSRDFTLSTPEPDVISFYGVDNLKKISFSATRKIFVGRNVEDNTGVASIDIFYTVEHGRWWLVDINEVEKND